MSGPARRSTRLDVRQHLYPSLASGSSHVMHRGVRRRHRLGGLVRTAPTNPARPSRPALRHRRSAWEVLDRRAGRHQSVWQRVAEDYAPFDVDVTTQARGRIGSAAPAPRTPCTAHECWSRPRWAQARRTAAAAASPTLAPSTTRARRTTWYYDGPGLWAPLMGVRYRRPLTQWSRGEYARARY